MEAFADHVKYFLTDHALRFYEEYVNITECVPQAFQPVTMQWLTFARANREIEDTV